MFTTLMHADEPMAVDRTDAAATARAVIEAYKAKDMARMAELAPPAAKEFFQELAEQGEAHPRYKSIYRGWRWEAISGWDGKIHGVRYVDGDHAAVHFADLSPSELAVVSLVWQDGSWMFDDIHSPDPTTYRALKEQRPQ
jgi:hypothetical protein